MNQAMAAAAVREGRTVLGIELGSTRIKACLASDDLTIMLDSCSYEWESALVEGVWTYSLEQVWTGIQSVVGTIATRITTRFGVAGFSPKSIGISAMMHGYLPFDNAGELLVPFRTWRNTTAERAAAELSDLFECNVPSRWSIAHLHQAILDAEPHVPQIASLTTLAGYVHERLGGGHVLGIGDASGMFPIDPTTGDYDGELLRRYDEQLRSRAVVAAPLRHLLPQVCTAGQCTGRLTPDGARLLDPSGLLRPGAVLCPPEGDAGTGMVVTNAVSPRTGNISVGTSIFAMVVLDEPLPQTHPEVDCVVTPAGDPVAMVHCNNGTNELSAWASVFARFAEIGGTPYDSDTVYRLLFDEAIAATPDAGHLLAYNYLAGEPVSGLREGRPLLVRRPQDRLTLGNLMRAHIYSIFATLALGMRILTTDGVAIEQLAAHGGIFRTSGVAQRFLAGALNIPITVADTAAEGGAWGMAVLAAYAVSSGDLSLGDYLQDRVFANSAPTIMSPIPADVAGFADYLDRYRTCLGLEHAATQIVRNEQS
ncbi:MAG: FGGY-family carbohydrate kinase [Gordonia sp. (in: high G+C Gram-positive bacteria)]